eukprot:TRINITY_DN5902_c0_g1_i1.p1 TRINITY_DN5902_c0_g1~~TRINITY_DN5902_c0_g1_i1.p1  ORF type:complete len:802 (-),score=169.85 TRINITY_DN5902_c0_g1_i1:14-2359(-)
MSENTTADSSAENFLSALVINTALGLLFIFLFVVTRLIFKQAYHRRPDCPSSSRLPFRCIWDAITYSDERAWESHGPDFIVYSRFLRILLYTFATYILIFVILIPINATADNKYLPRDDPKRTSGMTVLMMSNIPDGNARYAAHVVAVWFASIVAYAFLFYGYKAYIHDRRRWFAQKNVRNYSVMIRDLPNDLRTEPKLAAWFEKHYPGNVLSAHIVRKAPGLATKRKNYTKANNSLETAEFKLQKTGERPTGFFFAMGCKPKKGIDQIDYWAEQKQIWREKCLQRIADPEHYPATRTGFVTMDNSFAARSISYPRKHPYQFEVVPAPEPNDVLYSTATVSFFSRVIRWIVLNIAFTLLVFFWTIPIAFAASVTTLSTITALSGFGWLSWILDITPEIRGLIEGYLPTLFVIIFMAIILPLIKLICWVEAPPSHSSHEAKVLFKYWFFELFQILLVFSIIGSVLTALQNFINNPSSIPNLLAQALPRQATFYTILFLTAASREFLALWNPFATIIFLLKYYIIAKTPHQKQLAIVPPAFFYGSAASVLIVYWTIGLVYCVMAPIIIPFVLFFFLCVYIRNRHNLLFSHLKVYEGGGYFYEQIFDLMLVGMFLFQIVMIGLFAVNYFAPGAAIVPLPIFTIIFWWVVHRWWDRRGRVGVVEDKWKDYLEVKEEDLDRWKEEYRQPEFRELEDWEEENEEFNEQRLDEKGKLKARGTRGEEHDDDVEMGILNGKRGKEVESDAETESGGERAESNGNGKTKTESEEESDDEDPETETEESDSK